MHDPRPRLFHSSPVSVLSFHLSHSSSSISRKKSRAKKTKLQFTQHSILNSLLHFGVSSCKFVYLCLDDPNLTTRRNNTRNNIRINRNWIGHVTWTDQWGLNDSETHRRASQRCLGQCERVGSHTRNGLKFLLLLRCLFICLCSCYWCRLGL